MSKKNMIDVKQPDAFISTADKLGQFLVENKKVFSTLILFFVLVGVGVVVKREMKKNSEKSAANALYATEKKINKRQKEILEKIEKKEALKPNSKKNEKSASRNLETESIEEVDFEKDFSALTKEYETAILKYKGTTAALTATFQLVGLYFEYNQVERAKKLVDKYSESTTDQILDPLFQMLKATIFNHSKDYEKAAQFYKKVIDNKEAEQIHPEAYLKLGLTYQSLNDMENAKMYFTQTKDKFSNTEFAKLAKSYLRAMKLN